MLRVEIPEQEYFNDETSEFLTLPGHKLELEHSLVSLSKWESIWEKPFLSDSKQFEKTTEETLSYLECMTLGEPPDIEAYKRLPEAETKRIQAYLAASKTATWIRETQTTQNNQNTKTSEEITSELIYYWMIAFKIPIECENWHLSRLLMLIRVCNRKNAPQKKMSPNEVRARHRQLNAERKAKYNTTG